MHEASLVAAALRRAEEIAREQGAARVTRVSLRAGLLSGLSGEALYEQFAEAARGTIAEGARVDVMEDERMTADAQDLTLESVQLEV